MAVTETLPQIQKGKNGIRRFERWVYGPPLDAYHRLRYPEAQQPNDITLLGMHMVQESADAGLGETPLPLRRRWKSTRKLLYGFSRDIFDGIRARSLQRKGLDAGDPRYGELLDLAVDRTQEMYLALKISLNNWGHTDKGPDAQQRFIDSLLTATATILPTIAGAQGRMLDLTVPEKSPGGGSRFDRVRKITGSYGASAKGKVERSGRRLSKMRDRVMGAYAFRSDLTTAYRTDQHDPTSFDIGLVPRDILQHHSSKKMRENLETWLHFVWFANQSVQFIQDKLKTTDNEQMIGPYMKAVREQLGGYLKRDDQQMEAFKQTGKEWQKAIQATFPEEFTYLFSDSLSPQALIRR